MNATLSLFQHHINHGKQWAEHDFQNVFGKTLRDLESLGYDGYQGKDVLDMGCGQRYPFALLCAAHGARVTAADVDYVKPDCFPLAFYRIARHNGLKRAIRSAARRLLFDRLYYSTLENAAARPLIPFRGLINFVLANPDQAYPLPSESFDLIVSNAVLEHVADVPRFASEVERLLKPGGWFYAIIHNFYSLSGGHHPEWWYPDDHPSKTVPPWDHLRENRFPPYAYLNRLKPEEYLESFEKRLNILLFEGRDHNHDPGALEGEKLLAGSLARELSAYPRELLLIRAFCLICRKD
jgi:SAM-dependent methyltransferase